MARNALVTRAWAGSAALAAEALCGRTASFIVDRHEVVETAIAVRARAERKVRLRIGEYRGFRAYEPVPHAPSLENAGEDDTGWRELAHASSDADRAQ